MMSGKFRPDRDTAVSVAGAQKRATRVFATIVSSVLVVPLGVGLLPASAASAAPAAAVATAVVQAAPSVTRLSGFSTARASVRVGGQLVDTVAVSPKAARTVAVQYRRAGTARFLTAYKAKASAQGSFNAFMMPKSAGTWQYRLVVAATPQAKSVVSRTRTVKASGRAAATKIKGFVATPATVFAGVTMRDLIQVSPRASRLIEVQVRRAGTRTWVSTSMSRSTKAGNFTAIYRPTVGVWQYRLVVKASTTNRTGVSASRTIRAISNADVTAPGPVTGLTSTSTLNSVTLAWTNPTAADFSGVTIRRLEGLTAPTFTTGTLVVNTLKGVTSFTNTGLSTGTKYTYALFAHDSAGNHAAAATVLRETAGTGRITGLTAEDGNGVGNAITLRWTNPADADFTGVMIRRAVGAIAPATATSGTLVMDMINDPVSYVTDVNLTPGAQYSYALFAHDSANNYAAGVTLTYKTFEGAAPIAVLSIRNGAGDDVTTLTKGVAYDFDAFSSSAGTSKTLLTATVDYGDGTPVATFTGNPRFWSLSHVYGATVLAGSKTVTLKVTDSSGVTKTAVATVTLINALTAAITVAGSPAPVQRNIGGNVIFELASSAATTSYVLSVTNSQDATVTNYGATASAPLTQTIPFPIAGSYVVRFSVSNASGQSSVDSMEVTVVGSAAAVLSISNAVGDEVTTSNVGDELSFFAGESSVGPAGASPASMKLDYKDGTPVKVFAVADEGDRSVSHAFAAAGTYQVTLTVTDSAGVAVTDVIPFTVSVGTAAPTATITAAAGPVKVGVPVAFTLATTGAAVAHWNVDTTGSEVAFSEFGTPPATVSYSFATAGTYTVTFSTNNAGGLSADQTISVTVVL